MSEGVFISKKGAKKLGDPPPGPHKGIPLGIPHGNPMPPTLPCVHPYAGLDKTLVDKADDITRQIPAEAVFT